MARVILTYSDYEALPSDGRRYELHAGELSVTPAPSPRHQRIARRLLVALNQHVETRELGELFAAPIDCILSDTTVVQPDLVYIGAQRMSAITARGIEGPPTLVVEILSPSTMQMDRSVKVQLYARHGVPYYWIVDPETGVIQAYALAGGVYELAAHMAGPGPVSLPPFADLVLDPASLWL